MGEVPVGCAVELEDTLHAKCFEKGRDDETANRVDTVDHHAETSLADSINIDELELEHLLDVVVGVVLVGDFADLHHFSEVEVLGLSDAEHFLTGSLVEEFTFFVEKFECVPLDRIMTCSQDDTTVGLLSHNSDLGCRSGG